MARTQMNPFEIEDETLSLVEETSGRAALSLRKRRPHHANANEIESEITGFRGLLRSKTAYVLRNICFLSTLAVLAYTFWHKMDKEVEAIEESLEKDGPHQSSFGGNKNPYSEGFQQVFPDWTSLDDNVGEEVRSYSSSNKINLIGHYWHDPYASVYSAQYYDVTNKSRSEQADLFLKRLKASKEEFGSWEFADSYAKNHGDQPRPKFLFKGCKNDDCDVADFQNENWQMDEIYVKDFIKEAKSLIHRIREGIFKEYGYSSYEEDRTKKSKEELDARSKLFQVVVVKDDEYQKENKEMGIATLSETAWNGLTRKILHALVTGNHFFVNVIGDGTAAGHGNNFFQSPIMQFHYLMEPVFDFLGISLISRNMAMKETSALFGALAGVDLFGESDILWYDSNYSGDSAGVKDLLYKQAILSGDRVPLILTDDPVELWRDSNKTAWIGRFNTVDSICGNNNRGVCNMKDHNSVCWIPRVDIIPPIDQEKTIPPGKYPGHFAHQLKARKLSMLLLHAIDASLDQWVNGIKMNGVPLSNSFWHVGSTYTKIREAVRTNNRKDSACDLMMGVLNATCHVEMHGKSEWSPRVVPFATSLRGVISNTDTLGNFYVDEVYAKIDLMPLEWALPEEQVDPHLIAISTSTPKPLSLRHELGEDDDFYDEEQATDSANNGTRYLRYSNYAESGVRNLAKINGETLNLQRQVVDLKPGQGWGMFGNVPGICDGTAQSHCNRVDTSTCLMAGHNDFKAGVIGDALRGWLSFNIPKLEEGLIFLRADFSLSSGSNPFTEGWRERNLKSDSKSEEKGDLKEIKNTTKNKELKNLPEDFSFHFSINGKVTELSRSEFIEFGIPIERKLVLYPFKVDVKSDDSFLLQIRIHSKMGRRVPILITHLYYA